MQTASRLVLDLAHAARRHDPWATTNALRTLVQNEEKKKSGGIAEHLRQLIPRLGENGRPHKAQQYLDEIEPKLRIDDLILAGEIRETCAELIHEQRSADVLARAELSPRNRVLLTGPPGNGKTSLAEGIAIALERPLYAVGHDTLIRSHLGETGERLREVVDYVGSHECVVLLDEFEGIAKEREDTHESGEMKRVLASLLVHLERLPASTIVVAATNHPAMLDRATWRRFQIQLELRAPDRAALGEYLRRRQPELRREQVDGAVTGLNAEGASYAEAAGLCDDIDRRHALFPHEDLERMFRDRLSRWMKRHWKATKDPAPAAGQG